MAMSFIMGLLQVSEECYLIEEDETEEAEDIEVS
jgi:hypothetical protein